MRTQLPNIARARDGLFGWLRDIIVLIALLAIAVGWTRTVQKNTKKPPRTQDNWNPEAQWDEPASFFGWLSAFVLWLVFAVAGIGSVGNILSGFLNPDYWALQQVLAARCR